MDRFYKQNQFCGNQNTGCQIQCDHGPEPYVVNIARTTEQNGTFRTILWTGYHLQLALMCIPMCGEIGLEMHPDTDQFLRIENGHGMVKMGSCRDQLCFQKCLSANDAILVPAGTWHNIINTGRCPLKLYSIYAPPKHPYGTVQQTKVDADMAEY